MNRIIDRHLYSVEEIREEVIYTVKRYGYKSDESDVVIGETHLKPVQDATSHEEMIEAIEQLIKVEPFNHRLRSELNIIMGFARVSRKEVVK